MWQDILYHASILLDQFTAARENHLHNARFSRLHELKHFLTNQFSRPGLSLGESIFGRVLQNIPTQKQRELGHMLLVGRTRGGKGLNIETQIYTCRHSLIANDIKGELHRRTAGYRKSLGAKDTENVFVFDPGGLGHRYDPLENRHTELELRSSATTILHRPNEGANKVFTSRAITMLTQIFLAAKLEKQRALPFTYKIINEGLVGVATILEIVSQKHSYYPNLATKFLDIGIDDADFKDKFLLSSFGTLCERVNAILTKETVRCFTGSDFSGRQIITSRKPITVYLRWPERDILTLSPLIHLVWNSLIDEMTWVYDNMDTLGVSCYPVLAILDEIGRTGFPNLPHYAATVAGRDISLLTVFQSLAQMNARFGYDDAQSILSNMGTGIFYPPSALDHKSAKDIEIALDEKSGFAASRTEHERGESRGESEQRIPLMPAHEIKLLGEDVIGFINDYRPFRLKRLDYRRFPELVKRANMRPPVVPNLPAIPANHQFTKPFEKRDTQIEAIPLFLSRPVNPVYPE